MGMFDGINEAPVFDKGNYLPPGFIGIVEVVRTIGKNTQRSGPAFIVEMEIVEVFESGDEDHELSPVKVGQKRTWFQKMSDKSVALPAVKAWAAACLGFSTTQKAEIEEEVSPELEDTLEYACDNEDDNPFVGIRLKLSTCNIITQKNKQNFTRYDFEPYSAEEEG